MGKRAVAQVELRSKAPRKLKKDTVTRENFYEASRTLEGTKVIGVSRGTIWVPEIGDWVDGCQIDVDGGPVYLSDPQVRELIQVLKDYLSAKED